MSAAKIAASLRFIGWTGRLGSSSSEYSELGNRYETFQAQIATAWFLGSDRPLFGGAARLNARSRRSAVGPDRVKTRTPGRQFMNFSRFSAFSAITGPAERKNSLQMRRFQTISEFSHGLDPKLTPLRATFRRLLGIAIRRALRLAGSSTVMHLDRDPLTVLMAPTAHYLITKMHIDRISLPGIGEVGALAARAAAAWQIVETNPHR